MENLRLLLFLLMATLVGSAMAQKSQEGVWKSDPGSEQVTITVLKDTPELLSWRVEWMENGKPFAYSWSGPEDGSMHPMKAQDGKVMGMQSAKKDETGALLRHGKGEDGSSFDARATLSDDGNILTDEITSRDKDGKESKITAVYRRAKD